MNDINYGDSFYNSNELRDFACAFLEVLPETVTALISTGSSGNSIASAMLALSPRNLTHTQIRKENEKAHGSAGHFDRTKSYAIVDDFIETGRTIQKVIDFCKTHDLKIECIIVAEVWCSEERAEWSDSAEIGYEWIKTCPYEIIDIREITKDKANVQSAEVNKDSL